MTEILIVEDDKTLNDGIRLALKQGEFSFDQAFTCAEAYVKLKEKMYDMILLDINLPDGNGYDLLRDIRRRSQVQVLMLTANDLEMDEVMGLELGADDYVTKPFSLAVLRARIRNLLRRKQQVTGDYETEDFSFRFDEMEFYKNGQEIYLSKTEQKLLKLLVKNANQTLSREILVDRLWTDGAEYVDENALQVNMTRLKKTLRKFHLEHRVETVRGKGYRLLL